MKKDYKNKMIGDRQCQNKQYSKKKSKKLKK